MKKLELLVMPLMAVSLLASCGGSNPTPSIDYCIVDFDTDGGTHIAAQKVEKGKTATPPTTEPTHSSTQAETFTFNGWDFDFATPITSDTTIKAKWDRKPKQYTITFNPKDEGTIEQGKDKLTVNYGTKFSAISNLPSATPIDTENFRFVGWALTITDQNPISADNEYTIIDNVEVYAIYAPIAYATITFSEESSECTLSYNDNVLTKGVPFQIPAGVDVTLKIESNQGYFPILDKKVEIQEAQTYTLNLIEQEIIVKVAKDNTCVIKAVAEDTPRENLESYEWSEINILSKAGFADTCFDVGDTKTVRVNEKDHNVRIIGINEDKDKDDKDIGITFEFATLISDSGGYSLATLWNDADEPTGLNYNYLDSLIRMALVGEKQDKGHILWAQKGNDHWSNEPGGPYTNKSVLEMLPSELTEVLVAPKKTVQCKVDGEWTDTPIVNSSGEYDKLFLLSPEEMGVKDTREGAYTYYQETEEEKLESLRIKKQVNGEDVITSESWIGYIQNYAGYNVASDNTGGGFSWLRSPVPDDTEYAWLVNVIGGLANSNYVHEHAFGVAPAFCI